MARGQKGVLSAYLDAFSRALSCVTRTPIVRRPIGQEGTFAVAFATGTAQKVQSTPRMLLLFVEHLSTPRSRGRQWEVKPVYYDYTLTEERDGAERPILSYHWHPRGRAGEEHKTPWPHLHVYGRPDVGHVTFHKAHLPTGVRNHCRRNPHGDHRVRGQATSRRLGRRACFCSPGFRIVLNPVFTA